MRQLAGETIQLIKTNGKNLLIFEVVYRLITYPILFQLMNHALRFALKQAGYSYLTMGNVWQFLLKPWTPVMLAGVSIVGIVFVMIEVGGLITAYSGAAYSLRLNPVDIFLGGFRVLADEIKKKNIKLAGVVLAQLALINLYFIYRVLTHVKPLDFVMTTMLGEPWGKPLAVILLGVVILIAVPSVFVLHGCMVEQKTFQSGINLSMDLLKGRMVKTVTYLLICQLLVILTAVAVYLISVIFAGGLVVALMDKKLEFAFLMQVSNRIEWVLLFVAGIASSILHLAAVTVQYYQYHSQMHREPRWNFNYSSKKGVSKKRMTAAGLLIIAATSLFCLFDTAYNGNLISKSMMMETEITAHRGSSKTAPENTMSAMIAAVEELADWAEIDVQETADGQVILGHDGTLKRVAGINKRAAELTLEELRQLDVGSWFSKEYKGEPIPTLADVMEYAKGKIDLNIEIKNLGRDSPLPEKVLELVDAYDMREQCVITSVNINYLHRIKELAPEVRTGYILSAAYGDYFSDEKVDFISIRSSFVTESMIQKSHEAGKAVHAWTVNSRGEMERLKVLGVDNIITDYPVQAREVLYREEVTENLLQYLRLLLKS